jgi:hypothetical protein
MNGNSHWYAFRRVPFGISDDLRHSECLPSVNRNVDGGATTGAVAHYANERCMKRAAEMALFSVFTVLDGESFIEDVGPKGEFKLFFEKDGKTVLLNPPSGNMLHDLMPQDSELG